MEWSAVILFLLHLKACLQGEHVGNLTKFIIVQKLESIKFPYGCCEITMACSNSFEKD